MATYTVIGVIDENGEAEVAGILEGAHAVTQGYYDRWWSFIEADSVEQAEMVALIQIQERLGREDPAVCDNCDEELVGEDPKYCPVCDKEQRDGQA